jgi:hypothetical protein
MVMVFFVLLFTFCMLVVRTTLLARATLITLAICSSSLYCISLVYARISIAIPPNEQDILYTLQRPIRLTKPDDIGAINTWTCIANKPCVLNLRIQSVSKSRIKCSISTLGQTFDTCNPKSIEYMPGSHTLVVSVVYQKTDELYQRTIRVVAPPLTKKDAQ